MSSNYVQLLLTLAGVSALFVALSDKKSKTIVEHFGMIPPRVANVQRVVENVKTGDFVDIHGNYQAMLNPRQAGMVDYGASIRYKFPEQKYRADDMGSLSAPTPTSQQNIIVEKFCGSCGMEGYCGPNGCNNGPMSNQVPSSFAQPSYAQQQNQMDSVQSSDQIPVYNQGAMDVDALGQASMQPVVYDRYVYANQKNRLQGLGDPIRGDLPISPIERGWFTPSAQPQTMLRDSALVVMGGAENDTTRELMALKTAVSGGSLDTGSGINYSVQKSSFASAAGGDISANITAFP